MNAQKKTSLHQITGQTHAVIPALISPPARNRTILIEKETLMGDTSPSVAFEGMVEKIALITTNRRPGIENLLIVTGSPKDVRKMSRKALNAEIQTRLVSRTTHGDDFRKYISVIIAHDFGKSIMKNGFSASMPEKKAGAVGNPLTGNPFGTTNTSLYTPTSSYTPTGYTPTSLPPVTPFESTPDGDVESAKNTQNWGSILSGSAQVINSVGGIIGLFSGGAPGSNNNNVFNGYSQDNLMNQQQQYEQERKRRNAKIAGGIVLSIVIVVSVVLIVRAAKKKKDNK